LQLVCFLGGYAILIAHDWWCQVTKGLPYCLIVMAVMFLKVGCFFYKVGTVLPKGYVFIAETQGLLSKWGSQNLKLRHLPLLLCLFRVKIMTTFSEPTFLPPGAEPIATYCQQLQLLKQLKGIEALRRWRISCVRTFKSKSVLQHKYVSATIINPKNKTHYLVLEGLICLR
jgi:hypothetical protein